ncbi:MAG TPA: hypothetical protein VI997_07155, partial [Candidatus Thermoplasmatota archaeon]|nr:hypothetical protein [Candidatus Thermoplasmatota archaeon]
QGAALAATTAFSVHALLDARSVLPAAEGMLPARAAAESLAAAACVSYARHAFTDANETGWFWLSEVDADRRFVANAAALLAGACRRALTEVPAAFGPADAALVESRVDATVLHVVASAIDGRPWWSYDALRPEEANGISQQARIVHGLAAYRGAGGAVALPWDDATLAATLLSFRSGDVLLEYAADGVAVPEGLVDRPARLWGVGMAAGAQACWGDREEAQRLIDGLRERYGPWPNLTLYPNDYSDDTRFYGRHAAYALWALAVVESPPDACLGGPESDMTP